MSSNSAEQAPLLPSHHDNLSEDTSFNTSRDKLKHFLLSKYAHYMVIILVGLDVAGIFAGFLISLHICEHTCHHQIDDHFKDIAFWEDFSHGLGIVSLIISTLFMVELLTSIYAFGLGYFKVPFHIIDCVAIVASFVVDVIGRGQQTEAVSLIIALRFFRIFKIIEEGSAAAEVVGSNREDHIRKLEQENESLRNTIAEMRSTG